MMARLTRADQRAESRAAEVRRAVMASPLLFGRAGQVQAELPSGHTVVFDEVPQFGHNRRGAATAVDAMVRVFDRKGREVRVDPHAWIVNPPTQVVVDGQPRLDPVAAYLHALQDVLFRPDGTARNPKGWRTKGTATVVYGNESDVYVVSGLPSASYAEMCAGTGVFGTSSTALFFGQRWLSLSFIGYQSGIEFDTSVLDDEAEIEGVDLALHGTGLVISTNKAHTLQARAFDWSDSGITPADWRTPAQFSALPLLATFAIAADRTPWNVSGYNTFTENGTAFRSAINKSGSTYIWLSNDAFASADEPGVDERQVADCRSADQSGTTQDPKLTITTPSVGAPIPVILHHLRQQGIA